MRRQKKYYKAVRHGRNGDFVSAFVNGDAFVTYNINEFAEAPAWLQQKGFHLVVFDSLEAARAWKGKLTPLFECEVEGVVTLPDMRICSSDITPQGFDYNLKVNSLPWPRGTVMARRVRLISSIE
jgi:hypothetical protein